MLPKTILLTEILRKKNNRVCFDKSSQGVDAIEAGETMMGRKLRKHLCFLELMEQPSYSWLIAGNSNIDQKTNQYSCIQRLIGQYNLVACCVYLGNTKRNKAKDVWPLLLGFLISFKSNMLMCSPCGFSKCARCFNSLQNMFQISRPCLDKNPINFPIETFLRKEKINLYTALYLIQNIYWPLPNCEFDGLKNRQNLFKIAKLSNTIFDLNQSKDNCCSNENKNCCSIFGISFSSLIENGELSEIEELHFLKENNAGLPSVEKSEKPCASECH